MYPPPLQYYNQEGFPHSDNNAYFLPALITLILSVSIFLVVSSFINKNKQSVNYLTLITIAIINIIQYSLLELIENNELFPLYKVIILSTMPIIITSFAFKNININLQNINDIKKYTNLLTLIGVSIIIYIFLAMAIIFFLNNTYVTFFIISGMNLALYTMMMYIPTKLKNFKIDLKDKKITQILKSLF